MDSGKTFTEHVRVCSQRIAESGAPALAGLFDLTSVRLVRYATTITRNQHDAEDAVQAALVKVADKTDLLFQTEQPWHYLLRMVRNESLVILRRKKRTSSISGQADITDLMTHCSVDELEQQDDHRAVWLALRTLPDQQSEVVVLKIWEELTFAEIAGVLEVSMSTAASRYRYAIEKLAERLRPRENSEVIF